MPILIDSEELRTQRMPSPNKLHHFRQPRRDTVSFRNAVVTPSEVERLCLGVGLWISDVLARPSRVYRRTDTTRLGLFAVQGADSQDRPPTPPTLTPLP
jgi:hypothetical protein